MVYSPLSLELGFPFQFQYYIPNGYDYSASKSSMWLMLLYFAAPKREILSTIHIHYTPKVSAFYQKINYSSMYTDPG